MTAMKSTSSGPVIPQNKSHGVLHPAVGQEIHRAERLLARATIQMARAWTFLDTRFQPKIHKPNKRGFQKKATIASMARGTPKISPTYFEYSAQFMPN